MLERELWALVQAQEERIADLAKKLKIPAEVARYSWGEVPEMCPECDSRDFISSGPKHFVCLHCCDVDKLDKTETKLREMTADRDRERFDASTWADIWRAHRDIVRFLNC